MDITNIGICQTNYLSIFFYPWSKELKKKQLQGENLLIKEVEFDRVITTHILVIHVLVFVVRCEQSLHNLQFFIPMFDFTISYILHIWCMHGSDVTMN